MYNDTSSSSGLICKTSIDRSYRTNCTNIIKDYLYLFLSGNIFDINIEMNEIGCDNNSQIIYIGGIGTTSALATYALFPKAERGATTGYKFITSANSENKINASSIYNYDNANDT